MRPTDQVTGRIRDRRRGVARRGGDQHRIGQERGARCDGAEFRGELAVGQVQRAVPDQAEGGGIPERGGAAVAEYHLVSLG